MYNQCQDWKQIVLQKPNTKQKECKPHFEVTKTQKIENETDGGSHETVGMSTGKIIQNLRIAKGYKTQKDLANAINVNANLINQYEQGKVIPDNAILQKLKRVLGKF